MDYPLTDEQLTDLQEESESSFTITLDLSDDAIAEMILDRIIDKEVDRNSVSALALTITVSAELAYAVEEDRTIPCSGCGIPIPEPDENFAQEDAIAAAMCDCCYGVENA